MRDRIQKILLPLFLLASGCVSTALRDAVNQTFPPVNHVDHQVTAVRASAAELAAFTEPPTVYASLRAADMQQLLPASIAMSIKASPAKDVEFEAADVTLGFGPQEAIVTTRFDIRVPSQNARATGKATAHCAVAVERGAIVLRPSGSDLELASLEYRGTKAVSVLVPLLNAALRTFLENVNGAIAAQRIPLRFQATKSVDLAETLRQVQGVSEATGTLVTAGVALGSTAVLIEPRAVRVLGTAVFLTPEQFETSFKTLEARVRENRTNPLSSSELAALAACSDPVAFASAINAKDPAAVMTICTAAEKGLAPLHTEHYPTTSDAYNALAASYPAYHDGFMLRAQQVEPGPRLFTDETLVAISRPALATGLQSILGRANASATYTQAIPPQTFNQLITPTTTDLKCTENAGGCESDFLYPPYNPRGCDSNCSGSDRKCAFGICVDVPWVDLGCVARKAGCEATKEGERQAYESAKAVAKAAWSAQKAACELRKAVTKAGCQLNQGWLDAWASKEIARVEGTASVPDLRVFAAVDQVRLAPDFTSLSIDYRFRADARVAADARVTPLNGGHLICVMPANLSLNAQVHADAITQNVTATEQPPQRAGDDLRLNYAISGQQVTLTFTPSLAAALFDQNTDKLLLSCPAPVAIVSSIPGFTSALVGLKVALRISPNLFTQTKTIDIPGKTVSLTVPAQHIGTTSPAGNHAEISIYPEWGASALIFSAKVARK